MDTMTESNTTLCIQKAIKKEREKGGIIEQLWEILYSAYSFKLNYWKVRREYMIVHISNI